MNNKIEVKVIDINQWLSEKFNSTDADLNCFGAEPLIVVEDGIVYLNQRKDDKQEVSYEPPRLNTK